MPERKPGIQHMKLCQKPGINTKSDTHEIVSKTSKVINTKCGQTHLPNTESTVQCMGHKVDKYEVHYKMEDFPHTEALRS